MILILISLRIYIYLEKIFTFLPPYLLPLCSYTLVSLSPLNPLVSFLAYTIRISLFHHFHQNINMISCLPPLKILSRSFQLHCISLLHCLAKPFQRVACFHCPHFIFHSLKKAHHQAFVSITPRKLLSSKHLLIPPRTSTWPKSNVDSPSSSDLVQQLHVTQLMTLALVKHFHSAAGTSGSPTSLATPSHFLLLVGSPFPNL